MNTDIKISHPMPHQPRRLRDAALGRVCGLEAAVRYLGMIKASEALEDPLPCLGGAGWEVMTGKVFKRLFSLKK